MLGQSGALKPQMKETIQQFVFATFAPIFFASVGLKVNLLHGFSPGLFVLVLTAAVLTKLGGCSFGAQLGGMNRRDALSVGIGMSAGGAMVVVLALMGLQARIISANIFSALVLTAMVTSLAAGPLLRWSVQRRRVVNIVQYLRREAIILNLTSRQKELAIRELLAQLDWLRQLDAPREALQAVLEQEKLQSSGLRDGVAIPHGRTADQRRTVIAIGRSASGIDFDALDGNPCHLIFLLISPKDDQGEQVQLQAQLTRHLVDGKFRQALLKADSSDEVLRVFRRTQLGLKEVG